MDKLTPRPWPSDKSERVSEIIFDLVDALEWPLVVRLNFSEHDSGKGYEVTVRRLDCPTPEQISGEGDDVKLLKAQNESLRESLELANKLLLQNFMMANDVTHLYRQPN